MNYELAKELSLAGFQLSPHHKNDFAKVTLSELIEACGEDFRALVNEGGKWRANTLFPGGVCIEGKATPEESVARLWLALNKK